jgi:hypothetical protein
MIMTLPEVAGLRDEFVTNCQRLPSLLSTTSENLTTFNSLMVGQLSEFGRSSGGIRKPSSSPLILPRDDFKLITIGSSDMNS